VGKLGKFGHARNNDYLKTISLPVASLSQKYTKIAHEKLRTDYERRSFASVLGNLENRNMQ